MNTIYKTNRCLIIFSLLLLGSCCTPNSNQSQPNEKNQSVCMQKIRKQEKRVKKQVENRSTENKQPKTYQVVYELKSLSYEKNDSMGIHGSFFLGCGSVNSYHEVTRDYFFYVKMNRGYILRHIPCDKVYLIESDTISPRIIKTFTDIRWYEGDYWDHYQSGWLIHINNCGTHRYPYVKLIGDDLNILDNTEPNYELNSYNYVQMIIPKGTIITEYKGFMNKQL